MTTFPWDGSNHAVPAGRQGHSGHHLTMVGRGVEEQALRRVLDSIADNQSRSVIIRGEAGVGKTALLDSLIDHAVGFTTTRISGVEAEVELAYAALQQLCGPFMAGIDRLPEPQRLTLETLFGLQTGQTPDRFMVGLAVLSLLADAAEDQPVLCVIDDAQWLDEASALTLAFVCRRLNAERIGVVVAVRTAGDSEARGDLFADMPEILIEGLEPHHAGVLLDSVVPSPLEDKVRDRIIAETRGNPLALRELPHGLSPAEIAFGLGASYAGPMTGRLEKSFARRVGELPPATQQLLLLASAEPTGDVALLWRAADLLSIPTSAVIPAREARLIELGAHVKFRHPLMRSAVYRDATDEQRRVVHGVLAAATSVGYDPDRLAWHRAEAADVPTETIAVDLEACAQRAKDKGGWGAMGAFLARAAELTPDPLERTRRGIEAAYAYLQANGLAKAHAILAAEDRQGLSELDAARVKLLNARIEFVEARGADTGAIFLRTAAILHPLDPVLASDTYLDALISTLMAGQVAGDGALREVATRILDADWTGEFHPLAAARLRLLNAIARLMVSGYAAGAPELRAALSGFGALNEEDDDAARWYVMAGRAARAVGDDAAWFDATARLLDLARRTGGAAFLPIAISERFSAELAAGHLTTAWSLATELEAVGTLTPHMQFVLSSWPGAPADQSARMGGIDPVTGLAESLALLEMELMRAVNANGLGRYEDALRAADRAAEDQNELGTMIWFYPEVVEAAVRAGDRDRALLAQSQFALVADACGTTWHRGVAMLNAAILCEDNSAETLYRSAIAHLEQTGMAFNVARAQLLFGEWLRRNGHRAQAREALRFALEFFQNAGSTAFAERSRRELAATGSTARTRAPGAPINDLTAQEALIARLAASGQSNPEIGAQLFLSPRTVEWHLGKVFGKLGVATRKDLRAAFPAASM